MKILVCTLFAIAATTSSLAHAQASTETYGGVTLSTSGKATARSRTGELVSDGGRVGVKLYGGWNLNEHLALEAGYANYGTYTLKNTGPGASGDAHIRAAMFYVAAKGTYMFNERIGVFGKLGVAHARFKHDGLGEPDVKMTRPMIGIGAQYMLTQKVALTLEVNKYGKKETGPGKGYNLNKLEAGVKFNF